MLGKKGKKVSIFIVLAFMALMTANAQMKLTGDINGVVTDERGELLPGAQITLKGEKLYKTLSIISNREGAFRFVTLVPGTYELEISLPGFNTLKYSRIVVNVGKTITIPAKMEVSGISKEISVEAKAPLIETKTPQISTNVESVMIENLPTGRSYTSVLEQVPGYQQYNFYGDRGVISSGLSLTPGQGAALAGFSVGGSAGNSVRINGVDVTDPAYGYTSVNPIYEAIEEIQVLGIGATAEYGNYMGAVINIVTKTGGNKFHGSLTGTYTDESLVAARIPDYQQLKIHYNYQTTGTFGGPLIKDKLFFFLSGSMTGQYMDLSPVGVTATKAGGRPNYNLKLDWRVDKRNTIDFMWDGNPSKRQYYVDYSLGSGYRERLNTDALFANWQSVLSEESIFRLKLNWHKDSYQTSPDQIGVPFYADTYSGNTYGCYPTVIVDSADRKEMDGSFTHYIPELLGASHEFIGGFEIEGSKADHVLTNSGGGQLIRIAAGPDLTIWQATTGGEADNESKIARISGFVQENMKVGKKLALNLGLRYENVKLSARKIAGKLANINAFSPRLGFSYDLKGDGKNVIRGSYGIYYNKMVTRAFNHALPGSDDSFTYMLFAPYQEFDPTAENIAAQLALAAQPENLVNFNQYIEAQRAAARQDSPAAV